MREIINILMAGLLFAGSAAMAASSNGGDSRTFGSFDRIDVARGIELHVACGPVAKAEISGRADDVADTVTDVKGHTLTISRSTLSGHHEGVTVRLSVAQPLVGVSASTGVEAEIEACAVSPDHIDVSANTGVTIEIAGSTGRAVLDANTGARIQPISGKRFDAKEAKVSANTGADITLCRVEHIDGSATLGANITAESKVGTVHTSMGAGFSVASCP